MDVVGSEIGQKMRSAIKAKLTELGCYVDDELPDYVMVMVANKRTRLQMEDDLQLFLGDNTELFVNWLHQVLKKLQEVTVTPLKAAVEEAEKPKEKTKEKKSKDNKKVKTKLKKADSKKSKKKDKDKEKSLKKKEKEEKKAHKSKKKSKHHEMIRPNVPPLLMNIEKESEPSITDVFAGQILKSHGITIDITKEEKQVDVKPVIVETKRPILPIIDPQTIQSQPDPDDNESQEKRASVSSVGAPRNDQIKEMNDIEAKIQGLKQKLAEQLDSMSEDEDFLNIRTEAEELMNDFAEDVFQEISSQAPVATPPIPKKTPLTPPPVVEASETPKEPPPAPIVPKEPETLPQIELNLPKRPIRERLGAREEAKKAQEVTEKVELNASPERFTPDREPLVPKPQSARSRLGEPAPAAEEKAPSLDLPNKRLTSKVSSFCRDNSSQPIRASVVRVRPRPRRAQPAPALLLRAVADAHKSLLDQPAKHECGAGVQRALVRPMRRDREREKHHIVIEVPQRIDADAGDKSVMETEKDGYVSSGLTKVIHNTEYMPSRRSERTSCRRDDTLIIETINIHNPTVGKDKDTQFIVTMDGFNPNAFLAKKLMTEGLLADGAEIKEKSTNSVLKTASHTTKSQEVLSTVDATDKIDTKTESLEKHDVIETSPKRDKRKNSDADKSDSHEDIKISSVQAKRLSNTSEESETQVIINKDETKAEKRKDLEVTRLDSLEDNPAKKRKASPIVFDVSKKEKKEVENESERKRTESASSETQVTVTTVTNSHKYDSVPPLSSTSASATADRTPWCRSFPLCRFGAACAFQHPACKFAAACTRRGCVYAHVRPPPKGVAAPVLASHVVPVAGFKSINTNALPSVCKFYPNCVNPACHFYHPKPCRYGKACINKLECNFYHNDTPKWRYPV